ncbi:MAG: hypothetical protein AAGB48_08365 [Planctomycetota bacterium]
MQSVGSEKGSAEHTPGPWELSERCEAGTQPFWTVSGNSGIAIAKCHVPHRWDESQIEANARLIAAAPEYDNEARAVLAAWHGESGHELAEAIHRLGCVVAKAAGCELSPADFVKGGAS